MADCLETSYHDLFAGYQPTDEQKAAVIVFRLTAYAFMTALANKHTFEADCGYSILLVAYKRLLTGLANSHNSASYIFADKLKSFMADIAYKYHTQN